MTMTRRTMTITRRTIKITRRTMAIRISRKDNNTCDNVNNFGKFDSNGDGDDKVNDDDVDDISIMMLRMIIIMKLTIIMMI